MGKNDVYSRTAIAQNLPSLAFGAVAQLIERVVRNDEVVGLIPICSTSLRRGFRRRSASYGGQDGWQAGLACCVVANMCPNPWGPTVFAG